MYSGFMDTPQNKNPPFPLAVIPTGSPFPVPKVCSFICGGRRPATGPQTSSGIWEDRRMGTVRDQEGGPGRPRCGHRCFLSALRQALLAQGPPGDPPVKGQREGPHPAQSEKPSDP